MNFFSASKYSELQQENGQEALKRKRLFRGLFKTRQSFTSKLLSMLSSGKSIDDALLEEIEAQLILADIGVVTSRKILASLMKVIKENRYTKSFQLVDSLQRIMVDILAYAKKEKMELERPHVILMIGVNGVGKTTTSAKIANLYCMEGKKVMMAACDTFRAAAIEQLQTWGKRLDIPVIAQTHGADATAVAFDAYSAARARGIDVLLIDTAGRQHTHDDLMEQLKKMKHVLSKINKNIPHEILLTVDAGNGQNIHSQVKSFHQAMKLTGLCVTKLDGSAKGGVVISIVEQYRLPVKYIGIGERVDDLRPFVASEFVSAMLPPDLSSELNNN